MEAETGKQPWYLTFLKQKMTPRNKQTDVYTLSCLPSFHPLCLPAPYQFAVLNTLISKPLEIYCLWLWRLSASIYFLSCLKCNDKINKTTETFTNPRAAASSTKERPTEKSSTFASVWEVGSEGTSQSSQRSEFHNWGGGGQQLRRPPS